MTLDPHILDFEHERPTFESTIAHMNLHRRVTGDYCDQDVEIAWLAWKMRAYFGEHGKLPRKPTTSQNKRAYLAEVVYTGTMMLFGFYIGRYL